ncbi:odorant receptor 131-2-like [Sparus aurata]|uniref:odorant receptor 131-2-like n=1 Tax=Sparus aurata TaxID=8175 RepID=UPI0011C0E35C|nr:odorant receptor 131-2-like [Sparus aurata]
MSYIDQSQMNFTAGVQYQGFLGFLFVSTVTMTACCSFLFINWTLIFTLRSKSVFRETSCYILLFNLLFADTVQMETSQVLFILACCSITLTYPVCGVLIVLVSVASGVSPLTLVVMSLERYVAVCYPLRHASIITIKNTRVAISVVWTFSSLNVLARLLLLIHFPFEDLQMKDFCSIVAMFPGPMSDLYDKAYTCFLFISAGMAVISSYIAVMVAARSASTDKVSAHKARNTLLLHLVQLGLSLSSTIYRPILTAISINATMMKRAENQVILYVFVSLFPRCLSSLIYGIRDRTIRPVLMYNLCCRIKQSPISAKAKI